jgi:hypothetical protein
MFEKFSNYVELLSKHRSRLVHVSRIRNLCDFEYHQDRKNDAIVDEYITTTAREMNILITNFEGPHGLPKYHVWTHPMDAIAITITVPAESISTESISTQFVVQDIRCINDNLGSACSPYWFRSWSEIYSHFQTSRLLLLSFCDYNKCMFIYWEWERGR